MTKFEKLFESREHKRERLEEYKNYKDFCELMVNRVGETVYFKDDDEYHCFYISNDLLKTYDEYNVDPLYCLDVVDFPHNIDTSAHFYLKFKELMKLSHSFIYNEELKKILKVHRQKIEDRKKEISLMIKTTLYHNTTKSPTDKDYLLSIQRVYECNGLYYVDAIESDLHKNQVANKTYKVDEWFVKWYEEGDGVKIIDARKEKDLYN